MSHVNCLSVDKKKRVARQVQEGPTYISTCSTSGLSYNNSSLEDSSRVARIQRATCKVLAQVKHCNNVLHEMRKIGILEKIIRRFSAKEKLLEEKKIGLEVAIYKRYNNKKNV